tara:strand:+ start:31 stop:387 length:357 start_codon:yes stop_codon:yes gene_type:complete
MSVTFETEVLEKLSLIEERLSNIEEKFDEVTNFAEDFMDEDGGLFGAEGLNTIKDTLSTFLAPQFEADETESSNTATGDPASIEDLVGSLKDFKDRLSGIKEAIADLPDGSTVSVNED